MSILLSAAGALGGLWIATDAVDKQQQAALKPTEKNVQVETEDLWSGRYVGMEQMGDVMRDHATLIVAEKMDRDLSGVPFRWLKLRNGGILRTYDMEFPPVSK
jgi:hypothetical protein